MSDVAITQASAPVSYDALELYEDPYPLYRRLRDEAPVYAASQGGYYVLSRFEDVQRAARDWGLFSNSAGDDLDDTGMLFAPPGVTDALQLVDVPGDMTHCDPPLHTRLRGVLKKEFRPSVLAARIGDLAYRVVTQLLEQLVQCDVLDFARDLAIPFPATLMCSWIGFPEGDHPALIEWLTAMRERTAGSVQLPPCAFRARDALREHVRTAIVDRRRRHRDDLLSVLVEAERGGVLNEDEVIGSVLMLFFAGISTTTALISNSLVSLHRFEQQRHLLRTAPELIPDAIEELLRFESPIQWLTRITTRDIELHGSAIPEGSRTLLLWGSANRDERRWEDPDELILTRAVKRNVAFGEGIHHCLGAPVARLEAKVLFELLMPLLADYEICGTIERHSGDERAIHSLPARVQWEAANG